MDVDKTIELINGLKDIPAMPHVIVRVLKLLYEDKAGASELADVVRCDQALCSKFLSLIIKLSQLMSFPLRYLEKYVRKSSLSVNSPIKFIFLIS